MIAANKWDSSKCKVTIPSSSKKGKRKINHPPKQGPKKKTRLKKKKTNTKKRKRKKEPSKEETIVLPSQKKPNKKKKTRPKSPVRKKIIVSPAKEPKSNPNTRGPDITNLVLDMILHSHYKTNLNPEEWYSNPLMDSSPELEEKLKEVAKEGVGIWSQFDDMKQRILKVNDALFPESHVFSHAIRCTVEQKNVVSKTFQVKPNELTKDPLSGKPIVARVKGVQRKPRTQKTKVRNKRILLYSADVKERPSVVLYLEQNNATILVAFFILCHVYELIGDIIKSTRQKTPLENTETYTEWSLVWQKFTGVVNNNKNIRDWSPSSGMPEFASSLIELQTKIDLSYSILCVMEKEIASPSS